MRHLYADSWCSIFLLVAVCCSMTGCVIAPTAPWEWFSRDEPDTAVGVISPSQRMQELRALAESASSRSAEEQQRISADLTETIKKEKDPLVRAQIIRTLAHYPTQLAGAVLTAGIEDNEPTVRTAACQAWADRKDDESVRILSKTLASDTNIDVRLASARALGEIGRPAAVPTLVMALDDSNPALQLRAVRSLESITGKDYGNDFDAWRALAQGRQPTPRAQPAPSVAEKVRSLYPF
jgi:HEAT repeat protein